jgi:hypothetical protein
MDGRPMFRPSPPVLFRHKITQWLAHVKQVWPQWPASISDDGLFPVISSSRQSAPIKPVERAVNS